MEQQKILVVDDEPSIAMMLVTLLKKLVRGSKPEWAYEPATAINKISQENYDLLITDQYMPDMNGIELAQAAQQYAPTMPIVLMTAVRNDDLLRQAKQIGISGFLGKPFTVQQLQDLTHLLLSADALKEGDFIQAA